MLRVLAYSGGRVIALASNVTAVCASNLPFSLAPVCMAIDVLPRMFPDI